LNGPTEFMPVLELRERVPPLVLPDLFSIEVEEVEVEIGSGRGMFLRREAPARPRVGFLGIERAGKWFSVCAQRLAHDRLPNVRLIRGDAYELLARWISVGTLAGIHILFPDPWPKKRHAKRRLLSRAMFDLAGRALKREGLFTIATDVDWYFEETTERLAVHPCFEGIETTPSEEASFRTHSALKYARRGRTLHLRRYARTSAAPPAIPPPPSRRRKSASTSPLPVPEVAP